MVQRRLDAMEQLDLLIQQAMDDLHKKHYLESENSIYLSLQDAVQENCFDFNVKNPGVFRRLPQEDQAALDELSSIIETIMYGVTDLWGSVGILSATREGVLWRMMQDEVFFPPSYLWQEERVSCVCVTAIAMDLFKIWPPLISINLFS